MDRRPHRALGIVSLSGIVSACASIMGVDEPVLVADTAATDDDAGNPGSDGSSSSSGSLPETCSGASCPCAKDEDCPTDQYCTNTKVCALGCRSDMQCAGLGLGTKYCHAMRRTCIECRRAGDCPGTGQSCTPVGACADQCSDASSCPGGRTCCNGLCVDLRFDLYNCGQCGQGCVGAQTQCCRGTCSDPLSDSNHCGNCTTVCSSAGTVNATDVRCNAGGCDYGSCNAGFDNCNGNRRDGCECSCGRQNQQCCPDRQCSDGLSCNGMTVCKGPPD